MKISQLTLAVVVLCLYLTPFVMMKGTTFGATASLDQENLKNQIKARIHGSPSLKSKILSFAINKVESSNPEMATQMRSRMIKGDYELCDMCIQLLDQTINQLMNIILNVGVIGSCSQLCNYLSGVGSIVVAACDLVCSYLGVEEFMNLINKADLDAIYGCQLVSLCPVRNCKLPTCAQFFNSKVVPQSAPKGTTFTAVTSLRVFNQTGTGELYFEVDGPTTADLSGGELLANGFQAGTFEVQVQIKTQDDEQNQIVFEPGQYSFFAAACEGECGSKHPNSRVLATTTANFTLTE